MSLSQDFKILEEGVALRVLPDPVLRFQGPDVRDFLQGSLTHDIKQLKKGQALAALHLTPKGKWLAALKLFEREDGIWAITSPAEFKALQEGMKNLLFLSQTRLDDLSQDYAWIFGVGAKALPLIAELFRIPPEDPPLSHHPVIVDGIAVEVIRDFDRVYPSFLLLVPRQDLERIGSALTCPSLPYPVKWMGDEIDEALRIEAKIPKYGVDVDEKTIPPEAGLDEDYISYTKGCYVGQETISRVKHYGRVNRHLARLKMKTSETLPKDAPIFYEGKEISKITSTAFSPRLETMIALAMLPREAGEKGKVLKVKTSLGEIEAIVM